MEVNIDPDNDQWPETELWSLKDFGDILRAIYQNNMGVERFVFHLLKKYHDTEGTHQNGMAMQKTLKKKLPIKSIKREKKKYYKITDRDYFSAKHKEDFDQILVTSH